jgi:hypothetical protein
MFGYSREELIGNEIAFIYPEDQLPKLEKALKATMAGGWTGELVAKRKNGELFPIAISSSLIKDDEGNRIAHMASHEDISERKRAENELKKKNEDLELFDRLAVGRELKMIELKKEINALLVQLGKGSKYEIAGEEDKKNYELQITNGGIKRKAGEMGTIEKVSDFLIFHPSYPTFSSCSQIVNQHKVIPH